MAWGFDDFGFDTYAPETPSFNMPDLGLDQATGWDTPAFQDIANNLSAFATPDVQSYGPAAPFEGFGDTLRPQDYTLQGQGGESPLNPNEYRISGESPDNVLQPLPASDYSTLTPPSEGDGGGFWNTMDNILSGAGKFAQKITPLAQLGMTGLAAAQGIQGQRQAQQQYDVVRTGQERQNEIAKQQQDTAVRTEQRAGPTYDAGREAYERAMRGEVPPSVNQQIENWKRGAKQLAASRAAKSGMGESSTLAQWYQWIDQQGESMKGNWVQSQMDYYLKAGETSNRMTGTGVNALAGAGNTTNQQVTTAANQQRSIEGLIGDANRILARLNAGAA